MDCFHDYYKFPAVTNLMERSLERIIVKKVITYTTKVPSIQDKVIWYIQ